MEKTQTRKRNFTPAVAQEMYNQMQVTYKIAMDVIKAEATVVKDSEADLVFDNKRLFEACIIGCDEFVFFYDTGEFDDYINQNPNLFNDNRRNEFAQMLRVFHVALNMEKARLFRYLIRQSKNVIMLDLLKSNEVNLLKLYHDSIDFTVMQSNCYIVLDAARELDFPLENDELFYSYFRQVRTILYNIRGKDAVDAIFNDPCHKDVKAAFEALYKERDPKKAMKLYEKAAAEGSADAMNELGNLYEHAWTPCLNAELSEFANFIKGDSKSIRESEEIPCAHPVAYDIQKAMDWFEKAAAANSSEAMENLGIIYLHGKKGEVPQNISNAILWLKKAAMLGNASAMRTLGSIYQSGKFVTKNEAESKRFDRMQTFGGYFEEIKRLKAEFDPNDPLKVSEVSTPVSNLEDMTTPQVDSDVDGVESEQKKPEETAGMAFWIALVAIYALTDLSLPMSALGALVVFAITYIIVR